MVVWVFAGGGEAEVAGLIPFLEKIFPGCIFTRKTPPIQKPGPKYNKAIGYGRTGKSLIEQIKEELRIALRNEPNICNLILVFDDLDCRDPVKQRQKILQELSQIPECAEIDKFVGFAAPELEAWIIADWNNSLAKNSAFRGRHQHMRWWLSTQKHLPFDDPESFSEYDEERDCCRVKLSDALIESTEKGETNCDKPRFNKRLHTPLLLREINPNEVQRKCPLFREMYNYLNDFCSSL
ncbi:MAG: DUF4276 family protein [Coleofasciculus sp. S288]|nr:DUF4276 family protein [Coleofasciculus sp. S288]